MEGGRQPTPTKPSDLLSRRRPAARWAVALVAVSFALLALAAALLVGSVF
jgi:hypothetical protein